MELVAMVLFGFSIFLALTEVYHERDWPRDTFRYVLIFGAILLMTLVH